MIPSKEYSHSVGVHHTTSAFRLSIIFCISESLLDIFSMFPHDYMEVSDYMADHLIGSLYE